MDVDAPQLQSTYSVKNNQVSLQSFNAYSDPLMNSTSASTGWNYSQMDTISTTIRRDRKVGISA